MLFGTMKRTVVIVLALALVGLATGVRPGAAKEAPKAGEACAPYDLDAAHRLNEVRSWNGEEQDRNTTVRDALKNITKLWNDVSIEVNELAFAADSLANVRNTKVVEEEGIEGGRVKLATALKRLLQRVPAKSGATYMIRTDGIEITTNAAVREELDLPKDRPVPPLFTHTLFKHPLSEALGIVAEHTGTNVLLDGRVADKAKDVSVTTSLANVPVETAVRLLADLGGLAVVRQDNVLYVTTRENAARLLAEQARKGR